MPNANVARPLQVGSDVRSLTFSELDGDCSEVFRDTNVMLSGGMMREHDLSPGAVSHVFPLFGGVPNTEDASHVVPGQFTEGGTVTNGSETIVLDDDLIYALRLPFQDERLAKWSNIQPFSRECVRVVSEKIDRRAIRQISKAARTAALAGVHGGGLLVGRTAASVYGSSGAYPATSAGADKLTSDLSDLGLACDNANWPKEGRVAFIAPAGIQVLTKSGIITNRDFQKDQGQMTDIARRTVGMVEGWEITSTLHLPSTNITTELTKYNGDYSVSGTVEQGQPAVLAMLRGDASSPSGPVKGAVGVVKAGGMRNVVYWDENRNCWLVKCQALLGLGKCDAWLGAEISVRST